jgi:hypothetical protein
MTFADLLKKGITNFIDKEFRLKAPVTWEYADVKIPEDPRSMEEVGKSAGHVKVQFEGPEFARVKRRKALRATGTGLKVVKDATGKQGYAFKDTVLTNGKTYQLKVRLKLRPMFKKSHLENPAFIKQSNNPRYWSQTFALEILGVAGLQAL